MCKIMVMSGINNTNRKLAWEFTKQMAMQLSPGNSDGLGYAAVTTDGELFGERWHKNSEAFVERPAPIASSEEELNIAKKYGGMLIPEVKPIRYNKFGVINEDSVAAITLHTRMATSGKEFINTHPFVRGSTSLIHNGVIGNARDLEMIQSTCDSEAILNLYVKHNVTNNIGNIQRVADKLQGYYACGVITETKKYGYVVDVFKDDRARLSAAYIRDMNILVFSTSLDDILTVCSKMGMEVAHKYSVKAGIITRLSTLTGNPLETTKFTPEFKAPKEIKSSKKKETTEVNGEYISRWSDDYWETTETDSKNYLQFPQRWRRK